MFVHKAFPSLGCDIIFPNPLDHSYVSPMWSLPSPSTEYCIDVPIDNPIICDANVDLGNGNNMFNMLGGSVDDYVSLG